MSILSSVSGLMAGLSSAAGVTLDAANFEFSLPKPSVPEDNTVRNTKIMTMASEAGIYKGSRVIYYDRLNLADMVNFEFTQAVLPNNTGVHAMLRSIMAMTGLSFTEDDLVNHVSEPDGNGGVQVLLEAKPESIGWTGSFLLVGVNYPDISTAFDSNILPGF